MDIRRFDTTPFLGWTTLALIAVLYSFNIQALPSKNAFRRLTDGVQTTRCSRCLSDASLLRNRHRCLYADGRLYFLSLKGKRQPSYGSYHETALYGGYVSAYGVGENETDGRPSTNDASAVSPWSWSHTHFDAIDKNENREDAFFVLKNTLFLLVYTRFENVTYRVLYAWRGRTPSAAWVNVPLDVESRAQILDGNIQNGGIAWTTADKENRIDNDESLRTLFLTATDGWGRIVVSKLEVNFDQRSSDRRPISATIRYLIDDDTSPVSSGGAVVALTHRSNRLFAFYGTQGCGFHWEKKQLIIIDLNSTRQSIDYLNLTSENDVSSRDFAAPPWAFNGPALIERIGDDWLMFGGSIASGITGTEFDGRIWIFNLDTLRWRKSKRTKVPDQLNPYDMCSTIDSAAKILYVADFRNVYKASLEQLRQ